MSRCYIGIYVILLKIYSLTAKIRKQQMGMNGLTHYNDINMFILITL